MTTDASALPEAGLDLSASTIKAIIVAGEPGQPVLISWDDTRTLFHELGHALHALSSRVDYLSLNTGVRDYTEFQSQLLEHWVLTDPVIERYLVHVETGEPIGSRTLSRLLSSATILSFTR